MAMLNASTTCAAKKLAKVSEGKTRRANDTMMQTSCSSTGMWPVGGPDAAAVVAAVDKRRRPRISFVGLKNVLHIQLPCFVWPVAVERVGLIRDGDPFPRIPQLAPWRQG